jgi:hypothetical protein
MIMVSYRADRKDGCAHPLFYLLKLVKAMQYGKCLLTPLKRDCFPEQSRVCISQHHTRHPAFPEGV